MPEQSDTLAASGPDMPATLGVEELAATPRPDLGRLRERVARQQVLVDEAVAAQAAGRNDAPPPADRRKKLRQLEQELVEAERLDDLIERAQAEMSRRHDRQRDLAAAEEANKAVREHIARLQNAATTLHDAANALHATLDPLRRTLQAHPLLTARQRQFAAEQVAQLAPGSRGGDGASVVGQPLQIENAAAYLSDLAHQAETAAEARRNGGRDGGGGAS